MYTLFYGLRGQWGWASTDKNIRFYPSSTGTKDVITQHIITVGWLVFNTNVKLMTAQNVPHTRAFFADRILPSRPINSIKALNGQARYSPSRATTHSRVLISDPSALSQTPAEGHTSQSLCLSHYTAWWWRVCVRNLPRAVLNTMAGEKLTRDLSSWVQRSNDCAIDLKEQTTYTT